MSEWQPIETAPRDGTEFLAYDSATGKMDVCTMEQWLGSYEARAVQSDGEYGPGPGDFGYRSEAIRHWQPLPAPPASPTPLDTPPSQVSGQ